MGPTAIPENRRHLWRGIGESGNGYGYERTLTFHIKPWQVQGYLNSMTHRWNRLFHSCRVANMLQTFNEFAEEYRASRQLTTPPPCITTESSGVVMPDIRGRRFTHCGVPSSSSTPLSTRISRKARIGAMRSPFLRNAMQSRARSQRDECVDDRRSRDSTSEPEEVRRIPAQEPRRTTTAESRSRHSPESRSKHSSGGKKPRLVLDSGFSFQVLWGGDRNPSGNQSTREVGETSSPAVEDANSQRR